MKFFPSKNCNFYWEALEPFEKSCHYPETKSWYRKPRITDTKGRYFINYWRDLAGAKLDVILDKDLYFKEWQISRIRYGRLYLPLLYCTGARFIELTKAPPAGFLYAPKHVNLATAREIRRAESRKQKGKGKKK